MLIDRFDKRIFGGGITMDVREKLVELSIEDALLVLREEHRQRTDSYTTYLAHGGKGDPAEEVGLDALAIAISALEKTKWISVKDRLPELGERVICTDGYAVFEQYRVESSCVYGMWDRFGLKSPMQEVTYWMPMPLPPKGE